MVIYSRLTPYYKMRSARAEVGKGYIDDRLVEDLEDIVKQINHLSWYIGRGLASTLVYKEITLNKATRGKVPTLLLDVYENGVKRVVVMRNHIDYLRSLAGFVEFKWKYTPAYDDFVNATSLCGIDIRQILEMKQAVGRVALIGGNLVKSKAWSVSYEDDGEKLRYRTPNNSDQLFEASVIGYSKYRKLAFGTGRYSPGPIHYWAQVDYEFEFVRTNTFRYRTTCPEGTSGGKDGSFWLTYIRERLGGAKLFNKENSDRVASECLKPYLNTSKKSMTGYGLIYEIEGSYNGLGGQNVGLDDFEEQHKDKIEYKILGRNETPDHLSGSSVEDVNYSYEKSVSRKDIREWLVNKGFDCTESLDNIPEDKGGSGCDCIHERRIWPCYYDGCEPWMHDDPTYCYETHIECVGTSYDISPLYPANPNGGIMNDLTCKYHEEYSYPYEVPQEKGRSKLSTPVPTEMRTSMSLPRNLTELCFGGRLISNISQADKYIWFIHTGFYSKVKEWDQPNDSGGVEVLIEKYLKYKMEDVLERRGGNFSEGVKEGYQCSNCITSKTCDDYPEWADSPYKTTLPILGGIEVLDDEGKSTNGVRVETVIRLISVFLECSNDKYYKTKISTSKAESSWIAWTECVLPDGWFKSFEMTEAEEAELESGEVIDGPDD